MPDVMVFEDDPRIADLVGDMLRSNGLTVEQFTRSDGIVQIVQDAKPRVLVLDIMMPGLDGLSACKALKSNPGTRQAKIIVLTAKVAPQDQALALSYGADFFINKPFDVSTFVQTVMKLMGPPTQPDLELMPRPPAPPLSVTLLTQGAAIETELLWILFETGASLRDWIKIKRAAPKDCWIFISRYDKSTTSEISVGSALLAMGTRIHLAGPDTPQNDLQSLAPKLCAEIPMGGRVAPLLYPMREGETQLSPGIMAQAQHTQHPGHAMAYKIDLHGKRIVYCPAHEVNPDPGAWLGHEANKFRSFFFQAELMIHGYRRSLVDAPNNDGGGRGAWEPIIDLAEEAKVKKLVLFPLPGAPSPDAIRPKLEQRLEMKHPAVQVTIGGPGSEFLL